MPDTSGHLEEGTVHAWIDGALSPDESARVDAHVASCAQCRELVAEARGLVAAASRIIVALDDVPSGVIPGTTVPIDRLAALRARRRATRREGWWQSRTFLAAASLVFVAGTGTFVWRSLDRPLAPLPAMERQAGATADADSSPAQSVAASAIDSGSIRVRPAPRAANEMAPAPGRTVARDAASRPDSAPRSELLMKVAAAPPPAVVTTGVAADSQAAASRTLQAAAAQGPPQLPLGAQQSAERIQAALQPPVADRARIGFARDGSPAALRLSEVVVDAASSAVSGSECYELRGPEPARIRLLGVPERVRLTTRVTQDAARPGLAASSLGDPVEGVELSARYPGPDSSIVEIVAKRPLDSTTVLFSRSALPARNLSRAADTAAQGPVLASARRIVCPP